MIRSATLIAAALLSLAAAAADPDYRLSAVEDGDTILVQIDGKERRLQLHGIDAPEDVDNPKLKRDLERTGLDRERLLALGRAASEHLRRLIREDAPLRLEGNLQRRDRYGRTPVVAYGGNGISLNEQMVADGYAVMIGRYPLDPAFKERLAAEQARAMDTKRGLWGSDPEAMRAWSGVKP